MSSVVKKTPSVSSVASVVKKNSTVTSLVGRVWGSKAVKVFNKNTYSIGATRVFIQQYPAHLCVSFSPT